MTLLSWAQHPSGFLTALVLASPSLLHIPPNSHTNLPLTVKCSRPQWDADLRLAPERDVYEEGEEVTLSCPEGSLLPFQQAKCAWRPRAVPKGEHKGTWTQKNELGKWVLIQSPTKCISKWGDRRCLAWSPVALRLLWCQGTAR